MRQLLLTLSLLLSTATASLAAGSSSTWHWKHPRPQGNYLYAAAYSDKGYVAVGDAGAIVFSPDGTTWTSSKMPGWGLWSVTAGEGLYVAVGNTSTISEDVTFSSIVSSADGVTWTTRALFEETDLSGVAFGNGMFVAVGAQAESGTGVVYTSPDGVSWVQAAEWDYSLKSVSFVNDAFYATDSTDLLKSTDGVTWTKLFEAENYLYGIASFAGQVIAYGEGGIYVSADDEHWKWRPAPNGEVIISAASNEGMILLGAETAAGDGYLILSLSGNELVDIHANLRMYPQALVAGKGDTILAAGSCGSIATTTDGITWSRKDRSWTYDILYSAATADSTFVVVGKEMLLVTTDRGARWRGLTLKSTLYSATYGNSTFVAVGSGASGGVIYYATDVFRWNSPPGTFPPLRGIAFGASLFVAAGEGAILTSTDARNWQTVISAGEISFAGVSFKDGVFVAAGSRSGSAIPAIYYSRDGITWRAGDVQTKGNVRGVVSGNGIFAAFGSTPEGKGLILTSPDGERWTQVPQTDLRGINAMAFGLKDWLCAFGDYGEIATSNDLETWVIGGSPTSQEVYGTVFTGSSFLMVGDGGTVLESARVVSITGVTTTTPPITPEKPLGYKGGNGSLTINFSAAPAGVTVAEARQGLLAVLEKPNWIVTDAVKLKVKNGATPGSFSATVRYLADQNPNGSARKGTISVGSFAYDLWQQGVPCRFLSVRTTPTKVSNEEGEVYMWVRAPRGCLWKVSSVLPAAMRSPDAYSWVEVHEFMDPAAVFSGSGEFYAYYNENSAGSPARSMSASLVMLSGDHPATARVGFRQAAGPACRIPAITVGYDSDAGTPTALSDQGGRIMIRVKGIHPGCEVRVRGPASASWIDLDPVYDENSGSFLYLEEWGFQPYYDDSGKYAGQEVYLWGEENTISPSPRSTRLTVVAGYADDDDDFAFKGVVSKGVTVKQEGAQAIPAGSVRNAPAAAGLQAAGKAMKQIYEQGLLE